MLFDMTRFLKIQACLPQPLELGMTINKSAHYLEQANQVLPLFLGNFNNKYQATTLPSTLQQVYLQTLQSIKLNKKLLLNHILQVDGGSRGNPGLAGAGAILLNQLGQKIASLKLYLMASTNNVAEYQSLIMGLTTTLEKGIKYLEVHSDSKLLIHQLNGQYKINTPHLLPLYQEVIFSLTRFKKVNSTYIARKFNKLADSLANQAMNKK